MAEIAFAAAASHAPGLTGWPDRVEKSSQDAVHDAYARLGREIEDANLDVLLMVANDHILNYNPAAYPDFIVGTSGEHTGPSEWFKAWLAVDDYRMPGHPDAAQTIFAHLDRHDLRVAQNSHLEFDDNITVPTTLTGFSSMDVPLVPLIQNCTVPPVPDQRKSYEVGRELGRIIREDLPEGLRVGLFGSGGLSHEPGGPRYLEIDEEFDRWFLDLLDEEDHEKVLEEATLERMEAAGAGGTSEVLSWIVVMGAIGERPSEVLTYVAEREWRCGIGAVHWAV